MPGTQVTVRFGPPYELEVYGGCNYLDITTHLTGNRVIADGFSSTAIGCSPELLEHDAWLVEFFEAGPEWTSSDPDEIVLTTSGAELHLSRRE